MYHHDIERDHRRWTFRDWIMILAVAFLLIPYIVWSGCEAVEQTAIEMQEMR